MDLGSVTLSESTLGKIKEQYATDIQAQQEYITNTLAPLIREKEGLITKIAELERDRDVKTATEGTAEARIDAKDAQLKAKEEQLIAEASQKKLWLNATIALFSTLCAIIALLIAHNVGAFERKTKKLSLGLDIDE